ncbi:PepSY domain-containing protein [Canibacter sp. lx-45]|uniref:PepSY domain-containing protein n=1 Tax=Canibacter zhuwentaonis TaxID=2837491 RepID=UPI001BDC501C|nr:PepSY domain-containing protein [Canibacter zhuwentaonis]MBT1035171.1 PepSY domain-containing protein [Canibacter zhuwentaonis]
MLKRLFSTGLVTGVALVTLTACTANNSASPISSHNNPPAGQSTPAPQPQTPSQTPLGGTAETAKSAISLALQASGGGKIAKLDYDSSDAEWEIEVVSKDYKHEFTVSGDGSRIISKDTPKLADRDDAIRTQNARTTAAQALDAALAHTPGLLVEIELESGHGANPIWKVTVQQQNSQATTRVLIDSADGNII